MIDKLIAYSIKNKLIIGLFVLVLCFWGAYSLKQLPIDAVPDITNNQVQIITPSPSLAAQEVERLITFPVEITMATIPKIEEIRSFSRFGLSVVTIVFKEGVDIYWARQQVNERLNKAQSEIPEGVGKPSMAPITTGLGEIYQYVVSAKPGYENKYDATKLRTIQDWIIKRQLLGTPGVADVSSFGGYLKQYEIAVDPNRLKAMNVSISELYDALKKNNENTGAAYIEKNQKALFIRSEGLVENLDDIRLIPIKNTANGIPILVRDVAKVQIGAAVRYGASTKNSNGEVVSALVLMLKGANSDKVIKAVKKRITEIEKTLPEGVQIEPFLDRSELVETAIGTVSKNLAEGALIVIFVLLLLLGNFRAGLIVASVIPLALLFAFSMMHLFGVSGNLMSLGAIDFGLIVDGAVIIVEATTHHISKMARKKQALSQVEMDEEVYQSASRIRKSAAFGEIIILIVYLPILALVGIEGKMFKPMAQVVSFAILGAFILSLTYVPMISALFLNKRANNKITISDRIMGFFEKLYRPIIQGALNHRIKILIGSALLFIGSLLVFSNLGGEFIPTLDEGDFALETRVLTGYSLKGTVSATTKAEKILMAKFPEVKQVVSKIGAGEIPTDPMPVEAADVIVILKPKSQWTSASNREDLANKMAEALEDIPGVTFGFLQPIQMRFNELMTGVKQDVAIKIYGEDLEELSSYANQIGSIARSVDGAEDVYIEEVTGVPQIVVDYKRDQLAKFGIDIANVNNTIQTAFAGSKAGTVYENERRFDMVLRLNKGNRNNLEDVRNLFVTQANGQQIPLYQVADVSVKDGPYQIQRDNTRRRILVAFNVRNRDVKTVVEEMQNKIDKAVVFAPGYSVSFGGQFENLKEATDRLLIVVPIALLLIFVLLYFTFNSMAQSVLIFTAIPLSAIGGIFALLFRGMPFSISAGVGFIALFGVAVLNGIVLISEFNYLKKEGVSDIYQRIYEGTKTRLRPVLLTASVASLGFLPMALSHSSGAEVQKPLATVVIGGLISATILTLVILPILYFLIETWNTRKSSKAIKLSVIFMFGMGAMQHANAQKVYASLDSLVNDAINNNPQIKVAALQSKESIANKGRSINLPKTNFDFAYGQTNSIFNNDSKFSVSQSFEFPSVYGQQKKLSVAKIKEAYANELLNKKALVQEVKSLYYHLITAKNKMQLLKRQDSIYVDFIKAANIRYKTGESTLLEKANAEAEVAQLKLKQLTLQSNIDILKIRLAVLLNTNDEIDIKSKVISFAPVQFAIDSTATINNPIIEKQRQAIEVKQKETAISKSKILPDFTLGYFNQSFNGPGNTLNGDTKVYTSRDRFTGIQIGIAIPLFSLPSNLKTVEVAKFKTQQSNFELQDIKNQLHGDYLAEVKRNINLKQSIDFYSENALPQAQLILNQSNKSFIQGNIAYVTYIDGLNRALDIEYEYLNLLNDYQQSLIKIEYLMGTEQY